MFNYDAPLAHAQDIVNQSWGSTALKTYVSSVAYDAREVVSDGYDNCVYVTTFEPPPGGVAAAASRRYSHEPTHYTVECPSDVE